MSASAILAVVCWSAVILFVVGSLIRDRLRDVLDVLDGGDRAQADPVRRVSGARATADPFADPLELLWETPCAPDPRRLV